LLLQSIQKSQQAEKHICYAVGSYFRRCFFATITGRVHSKRASAKAIYEVIATARDISVRKFLGYSKFMSLSLWTASLDELPSPGLSGGHVLNLPLRSLPATCWPQISDQQSSQTAYSLQDNTEIQRLAAHRLEPSTQSFTTSSKRRWLTKYRPARRQPAQQSET